MLCIENRSYAMNTLFLQTWMLLEVKWRTAALFKSTCLPFNALTAINITCYYTLASAAGAARIRILLSTNNKRTTVFFGCSSNRMKTYVWRDLNERTPTFFEKALFCTDQRMIKDIRRKRGTRNKFARILFLRSLASTVSVHEFFIHAFHISTNCFNSLSLTLF